jgi:hypothetical protein
MSAAAKCGTASGHNLTAPLPEITQVKDAHARAWQQARIVPPACRHRSPEKALLDLLRARIILKE